MAAGDLKRRLWVAGLGIPAGIGIVYLGGWFLTVLVGILAGVGAWEVYRIAGARGVRPLPWLGVPAAVLLVLTAHGSAGDLAAWALPAFGLVLALTLVTLGAVVFIRGPGGDPLAAVTVTVFGTLYAGATLSFVILLRALPGLDGGGPGWAGAVILIFPLVVTWFGDTAAYFVGRSRGRRKLLPSVSPAKTVEGAVGGLVGATAASAAYAALLLGPDAPSTLPIAAAAVLGLLIGAVAQVGDLAESVLKREAGVKDSGAILPGHGGVLDRFDAVYFTVPLTYALLPFLLA